MGSRGGKTAAAIKEPRHAAFRQSLPAARPKRTPFAWAAAALAAAGLLFSLARPVAAATPKEVQEAIDRAKAYLYKQEKGDNWEEVAAPRTPGGPPTSGASSGAG